MVQTAESPELTDTPQPTPGRSWLRASNLLLALAFLAPIGTLFAWWLGSLPGHAGSAVRRDVFVNIQSGLVALFYVGTAAFLGVFFYLFSLRAKNWERGAAESRSGLWKQRMMALDRGLRMKTLLRDPAAGLMHSMIYYSFLVLFAGTVTLEIDHLLPAGWKFLTGRTYQGFSLVLDLFALVFIAGIAWAVARRYLQRPWRLRGKTKPEDGWTLLLLGVIGVTGLAVEAARLSAEGRPDFEVWSFAGYSLSYLVPSSIAAGFHQAMWATHALAFMGFLVMLPTTKLRHMFTSPTNMLLSPRERPKGAMREMPNLIEATDIETIGASAVGDFTWKQLFDTDACTMCGRCTSVCPANTTGKALDPREIVLKLGEVAAATAGYPLSPPISSDEAITVSADSVFERVTSEELWACTSCRACDDICPVNIEILDKILDMRRYLSLMESDFPPELGKAYVALENSSNPYGMGQQSRADWTKELDFEVKVLGEPGVTAEWLYWVGCAGSFDDRNRKVTLSTARLMHEAGVDFAILGPGELCTGDPARRTGNEYVFQQLALQNIETLNDLGITKVITQCPHCFNTLQNEYSQFGGEYQVYHHSEVLLELLKQHKLTPIGENARTVTFHDSCYLGRHNDVFAAPREVISSVANLIEMPRNGTQGLCCGAGGGRFWMEEQTGKKVNIERTEEAVATGADEIAVACPFCYVMLDDGVKELGVDERVEVKEISVILAERTLE
ncbi:MAG: heterodisulfide reductase-related iron-sulfur binding cluster [Acidimicrobiia bacterium]|nr:heterodisulfide reductase-related iron-sulfur binding cluster [Acidimicrobiia bacterium]